MTKEVPQIPDVDLSSFLNLDQVNDDSITNQDFNWNTALGADFFGDLNFDNGNMTNEANNDSFPLFFNDVALFNTGSHDPPMFELPAGGS